MFFVELQHLLTMHNPQAEGQSLSGPCDILFNTLAVTVYILRVSAASIAHSFAML